LVIVEGMPPVVVGIAAGTIAALASAMVIRTLVFGVSASDPVALAAVGATTLPPAVRVSPYLLDTTGSHHLRRFS
jgi:hypothetical protein